MQQEPILFSGTLKENILYGLDEIIKDKSKEEIEGMLDYATKGANAYDFTHDLETFP